METLIALLVILAIIGILWWAVTQIPLPPPVRIAASVIVAIVAVVVLLNYLPGGLHLR